VTTTSKTFPLFFYIWMHVPKIIKEHSEYHEAKHTVLYHIQGKEKKILRGKVLTSTAKVCRNINQFILYFLHLNQFMDTHDFNLKFHKLTDSCSLFIKFQNTVSQFVYHILLIFYDTETVMSSHLVGCLVGMQLDTRVNGVTEYYLWCHQTNK
jgi:hypothetical protein